MECKLCNTPVFARKVMCGVGTFYLVQKQKIEGADSLASSVAALGVWRQPDPANV